MRRCSRFQVLSYTILILLFARVQTANNDEYDSEYISQSIKFCDVQNTDYVKFQNYRFNRIKEGNVINGTILIEKTLQKLTADVTQRICENTFNENDCNTKSKDSRDVCSDLKDTNAPTYAKTFRESVSPKMTCPIKPGEYQIVDLNLGMSNSSSLIDLYKEDGLYETKIIFKEDNIPIFCVTIFGVTTSE
ncbi:hypothetical protein R5R35_013404 [Gryllus longicercus]|uniref:Uncharacterized protein n=1 Tax=Gryllus longicercus TaxID=2509291 RepID=A0AAN9WDQ1_9ORTH